MAEQPHATLHTPNCIPLQSIAWYITLTGNSSTCKRLIDVPFSEMSMPFNRRILKSLASPAPRIMRMPNQFLATGGKEIDAEAKQRSTRTHTIPLGSGSSTKLARMYRSHLHTCTTSSVCWSRSTEEREVFHHSLGCIHFATLLEQTWVEPARPRLIRMTPGLQRNEIHRNECLSNCGRRLGATPQRGATATPIRLNAMILSRIGQRSGWQTSSSFTPNGTNFGPRQGAKAAASVARRGTTNAATLFANQKTHCLNCTQRFACTSSRHEHQEIEFKRKSKQSTETAK